MAIEIKCNCGLEYRLDDSRAGENFKCRLCGAEIYLQPGVGRASPNSKLSKSRHQNSSAPGTGEIESGEDVNVTADSADAQLPKGKLYNAKPLSSSAEVASIFSEYHEDQPDKQSVRPKPQRRTPPAAWWLLRLVMWAVAIVFIFAPWLKLSLYNPAESRRETEHITGWDMATSVVDELRYTGTIHPAAAAPILESYTDAEADTEDIAAVTLGGRMMAIGAAVFLAAIFAVPVAGLLVLFTGPRVMSIPFGICFLSLAVFTSGWFIAASSEQMRIFLDTLAFNNCYMGISASVYLMLLVLAVLVIRAGVKPDYKLLQAIQWSKERQKQQQADT